MPWTADDIADLTGRRAIVTGANSGLGFHTARELARHAATVTLACRDERKGTDALRRIRAAVGDARVELAGLDLADLSSVRTFATSYLRGSDQLDLLVNNAGVMALPRRTSVDGFELQFATNHLGHFALTGLLLPALLAKPGARVVTVSSDAHRIGRINFADLHGERHYSKWLAYGQSKLANLLFADELDRRARAAGRDLISVAAHPGYAATNLQLAGPRMSGNSVMTRLAGLANQLVGQSDSMGALPTLYAASAPGVVGGEFFGPGGAFHARGYPTRVSAAPKAHDPAVAARLWQVSEQLTGVRYDALDPR